MATLVVLPATAFVGDSDAQMVALDAAATFVSHIGRPALAFDTTDEEAATSFEFEMPSQYTGSGLTAKVHWGAQATSGGVVWDVAVEAKTPNSDTLDLSDTDGFDSVNSATDNPGGTAGDPMMASVTLTNADSVAAGDLVRIGIRRDVDSGSDTMAGDAFLYSLTLEDDG